MTSPQILSTLQSTIESLAKLRDESKSQRYAQGYHYISYNWRVNVCLGRSNELEVDEQEDLDIHDRVNNLERCLVGVMARLDKAEESIHKCMSLCVIMA